MSPSSKRMDLLGQVRWKRRAHLPGQSAFIELGFRHVVWEPRGGGKALKTSPPVGFRRTQVLTLYPCDVLSVRPHIRQSRRMIGPQVCVRRLQLAEHNLYGPAVEHDVMERP